MPTTITGGASIAVVTWSQSWDLEGEEAIIRYREVRLGIVGPCLVPAVDP